MIERANAAEELCGVGQLGAVQAAGEVFQLHRDGLRVAMRHCCLQPRLSACLPVQRTTWTIDEPTLLAKEGSAQELCSYEYFRTSQTRCVNLVEMQIQAYHF